MQRIHDTQIGPAGRKNGIDLIAGRDTAGDDRRDTGLIPNLVAQGGQKGGAVDSFGVGYGLAGQRLKQIATTLF